MPLNLLLSDWNVLRILVWQAFFVFHQSSPSSNVNILERISLTPLFKLPAFSSPLHFLFLFSSKRTYRYLKLYHLSTFFCCLHQNVSSMRAGASFCFWFPIPSSLFTAVTGTQYIWTWLTDSTTTTYSIPKGENSTVCKFNLNIYIKQIPEARSKPSE